MVELLPCPFCGARGDLDSTEPRDGRRTLHWVECRGDECGISGRICDTPEAAATFWNRRAPYGVTACDHPQAIRQQTLGGDAVKLCPNCGAGAFGVCLDGNGQEVPDLQLPRGVGGNDASR